jgi:hypothetical protein
MITTEDVIDRICKTHDSDKKMPTNVQTENLKG